MFLPQAPQAQPGMTAEQREIFDLRAKLAAKQVTICTCDSVRRLSATRCSAAAFLRQALAQPHEHRVASFLIGSRH